MKKTPLRRRVITWAVVAVAALVVVLLVLVGVGDLRVSPSSTGDLTVSRVQWTILQDTINGSSTTGWFGPSSFNYSYADGYPLQTSAGGTFTVGVVLSDLGGQPHPMCSAIAAAPFSVVSSHPALPVKVPVDDDVGFSFTIQTPDSPGAVLTLNLTLNALNPPNCAG